MVIEVVPSELAEVISVTPAIWPRRRSNGAANDDATVAGSAPGSEAETEIIGESTRGIGATGKKRYATSPKKNSPIARSEVVLIEQPVHTFSGQLEWQGPSTGGKDVDP